ncbi:hypothetical protein [Aliidiomarina soli]|uniref:Uncharacterized protein n=1 Tax=Aliidiomarina soli TaxID=1928574 RepID=A0A432WM41_9GAMM|nr:hypothetical protein [Aliidiomarina soli]RUO34853.1 hypothetical protein CWE14_02320 [Aliidiomarina soli]
MNIEIMQALITIIAVLVFTTILYKAMPYRELSATKPGFVFFPKYKHRVAKPDSDFHVEEVMSSLGFRKKESLNGITMYSRGSVLGDISIKLIKVNVTFTPMNDGSLEYTVEPAWVVAFDTGDHWLFSKELGDKLLSESDTSSDN